MRVCHIYSNAYNKIYPHIIEKQLHEGIDARLFYAKEKNTSLPDSLPDYVDFQPCFHKHERLLFHLKQHRLLNAFKDTYKRNRFDLTHSYMTFTNGYLSYQIKKMWDIPFIVTVRDTDVNTFFRYMIHLRRTGIKILSEAEKIIFLSPRYRDLVLNKYIPSVLKQEFFEKSIIIPNGIDDYYLSNRPAINTRNQDCLNIVTVGLINKRKNQLAVCKAIETIYDKYKNIKYTVIGKVEDKKIYNELKEYSFVEHKPHMSKEDLLLEYRKNDIFIMPSLTETFGLTYAEAMSQGLPVIYTKGQGFDGQFEEGLVGYHVKSSDSQEIVSAIKKILKNYQDISRRCINLVGKFDWDKVANEYIEIYNKCK